MYAQVREKMASARSVRTEYDLGLPVNSSVIEALKRNYLNSCMTYLSTATERSCLANHNPTTWMRLQGHFVNAKFAACKILAVGYYTSSYTLPQVFFGKDLIGGYEEIYGKHHSVHI